jgi:cytochrome P450
MTSQHVDEATMSVADAASALVDPSAYADGRLERACDLLRKESPVHWVDRPGFRPFFALLKYDDIHDVERQGDLFHAGPRYKLMRTEYEDRFDGRSLVSMDPPEHTKYRGLVSDWFHPRSIRKLEDRVRELAKAAVDGMAERDEPYDFVAEISMHYPLTVICSMLGIPESDRHLILQLTQENFGGEDPEFRRAVSATDPREVASQFGGYFQRAVQDRLSHPTEDLTSMLAHAKMHGEPLSPRDLMGYLGILATAGHDTTSSTIAGGLRALIEHPVQLERLQSEIDLAANATEEMIRWVTPVKSFMRTAMADAEIRGHKIAKGQSVLLLYASANRDEDAFKHPHLFDVSRDPNRHLAFGHGHHFCLGAHLARLETRVFFSELLPRLQRIELAGEPQLVKTIFVGGLKHLPIRAEVV